VYNTDIIFRVKNDNFVTRKVGDEMVIVPLVNSVADMTRVLTLNETGTAIMEALDGQTSLKEVTTKLLEQFNVQATVLQDDLQHFITEALDKQIIEPIA
jgi:methyltransferase-like protein